MKVNLIFSIIFLWYEISLTCGMGLPERVSTLENTVGEIKKDQEKIETKSNALVNNLDKISDVLTAIEAFIEGKSKIEIACKTQQRRLNSSTNGGPTCKGEDNKILSCQFFIKLNMFLESKDGQNNYSKYIKFYCNKHYFSG